MTNLVHDAQRNALLRASYDTLFTLLTMVDGTDATDLGDAMTALGSLATQWGAYDPSTYFQVGKDGVR